MQLVKADIGDFQKMQKHVMIARNVAGIYAQAASSYPAFFRIASSRSTIPVPVRIWPIPAIRKWRRPSRR